ncbi:NrfD/PsrC family molybdoenzyme membrane anchor subunit [uncultured Pseudokineococcus sp.]|uniref:NrfD/PsrC family molybdoenzyme membrane anchor subunit n=1 Tax=uncultured Pseudokineococcus sp. TaxID=1642928 RepID=UPI002621AAF8|nr:NrfD/PsrC family molybdoenzyme membrane anchor subunit [uncultured Pseudokineococcus sp.]
MSAPERREAERGMPASAGEPRDGEAPAPDAGPSPASGERRGWDQLTTTPSEQGTLTGGPQDRGRPGASRRRRRGAEELMVPEAEFQSYYGRQVIHTPTWKVPDVPLYLYLGGLAGSSSVIGALADATGRPVLRRTARLAGSIGSIGSVVALIHDLGMPSRFLNMLRVFKVTSPLSVGSWILSPYSAFAGVAAAAEVGGPLLASGRLPRLAPLLPLVGPVGRASGVAAAVLGPPLATYTAVLIADTAVPTWHESYPELPFVFAGSGMAAAGGLGMIAAPVHEAGPARRAAVAGAALELGLSHRMEHRTGLVGEPYKIGRQGRWLKAAKALTAVGAVGAFFAGRSRAVGVASGVALNAGSLLTRFGVFEAGMASARDPKYTVVPQRERLEARRRAEAEAEAAAAAEGQDAGRVGSAA